MSALTAGRRRVLGRVLLLVVAAVALYVLAPGLVEVLSAAPRLREIGWWWFVVAAALEAVSFVCVWWLLRSAMPAASWFVASTSQLASNAFSRVLPGGAAAAGALQFRMLRAGGVDLAGAATALTATGIIMSGTLFAMPVLALPFVIGGTPVPGGLAQAAWIGAGLFVLLFGVGAALLVPTSPIAAIGRLVDRLRARLRPATAAGVPYEVRFVQQRDLVRSELGSRWKEALAASVGKWLFDYGVLLVALTAVGSRPNPGLVLLAYVAASVLAMIPITPGGLGFVEAGLTATLALAGVGAADAVIATLMYRLFSYWLPLPAGLVAFVVFRRRYPVVVRPGPDDPAASPAPGG